MKLPKYKAYALAALALIPFGAMADEQFDLFLPGITGPADVDGISGLIPVTNFYSSGNAVIFDKTVDATSELLQQAVLNEQKFDAATFYIFDSAAGMPLQLTYIFKYSDVAAESLTLFTSGDGIPSEELGFAFTSRTVSAVPVPPAIWLMLSGLGGFGLVARRRMAFPI